MIPWKPGMLVAGPAINIDNISVVHPELAAAVAGISCPSKAFTVVAHTVIQSDLLITRLLLSSKEKA